MGKRRTRKEKEQAVHAFSFSWSGKETNGSGVKGYLKNEAGPNPVKANKRENAVLLAQEGNLRLVKTDILKSLIIASLIVVLEVVLYLAWRK